MRGRAACLIFLSAFTFFAYNLFACTSALVGRDSSRSGRMLMWKHRDSGARNSFIDYIVPTDSTLGYVALFNAGDSLRREAWIGFNSEGFAVMNTASYNLAPDTAKVRDREGVIMTDALRRCRTLSDFTALLDSAIKTGPLGVQANFGAFDRAGSGAYIECSDHGYAVFPLDSVSSGAIIRTNYSVSGGAKGRLGEARYSNAEYLLAPAIRRHDISPELFTDTLSRSFYDSSCGFDRSTQGQHRIEDRGEMIPRYTSSSSIVIEGCLPDENPAERMVMWVTLGFPPVSHVEAVRIGTVPEMLLPTAPGYVAPASAKAYERLKKAFPGKSKGGRRLMDLKYILPISNAERKLSLETYSRERKSDKSDIKQETDN